ncbi:MAG: alpha/beta fold hydrolase, partial [Gammaproteobacteria bacterium]|nr:alpha/beta fold hydrolase [Gammaproteobacteria bacterium]
MAIYTQTVGRGPDLVLVHGWGVHGGIWDTLLPALVQHYRITCVDLPGHGYSRAVPMPSTLAAAALAVAEAVPAHATW